MKQDVKQRMHLPLLRGGSLQRKMTAMLLVVVLVSMVSAGAIVALGTIYLQRFNVIMNDCYDINLLGDTFALEVESFQQYVLYGSDATYEAYVDRRTEVDRVMAQVDITYDESQEQYVLMQAIYTAFAGFREASEETVERRVWGDPYAQEYESALRSSQYIEGYIRTLLQTAISQGQAIYQRDMSSFRMIPMLFLLSAVLSFALIAVWTRWMVRRVVSPINDLIRVTGEIGEQQYDVPDLAADEGDEIARLSRVVNEMKHSTARLVESLQERQEMESRLHAEELRRVTVESTMDTLRLSLLQSQINPHFLFNTLNIISRMAQVEEAPVTEELIVRLSSLFRYNLQSAKDMVPLASELKIVQDYIAIQRIRFGDRILFDLQCPLDPDRYTVPVFTMQPLIENAVIHGIGPKEEGGSIRIEVGRDQERLVIAVRDSGVGMSPEKVESLLAGDTADRARHVTGLGVGNVRMRILTIYDGGTFDIVSREGEGTDIVITIPLGEEAFDG